MTTDTIDVADELVDRADITDGKAVVQFSKTEAALADLRARHQGVVFDLTTTAGNDAARSARKELVSLRTGLEAKRKAFKDPVLQMGKAIDEQAKRITGEILELEDPIDQQIKADEARREAIRAEKARIEAERVAGIRAKIDRIREVVTRASNLPSERVRAAITAVNDIDITAENFSEFIDEASAAKTETLGRLDTLLTQAVEKEAEEKRQAEVRAEQERVAAEQREAAERLAAQQREIEEQQRKIAAERLERERAEDARKARISGRIAEIEAKRNYSHFTPSKMIDAAILQLSSNDPNEDLYGERLGEALALHAETVEHLRAILPASIDREQEEAAERLAEKAAAESAARAAIVPVASPVTQVREPDPAPAADEQPTLTLGTINSRLGFTVTADFLTGLGFTPTQVKAARLFRESQFGAICSAIADHALKVAAVKSLEKAA